MKTRTMRPEASSAAVRRRMLVTRRKDTPGELALRSARDPSIAGILRDTNDAWHRTLRGLLRRAAREGHLKPEMDSDGVAALVVATLTSLTLPTMSAAARPDQALRQLERWLGIPRPQTRTRDRAISSN